MEAYARNLIIIGIIFLIAGIMTRFWKRQQYYLYLPSAGFFLYAGFVYYVGVINAPVSAEEGMYDLLFWPVLLGLSIYGTVKTIRS